MLCNYYTASSTPIFILILGLHVAVLIGCLKIRHVGISFTIYGITCALSYLSTNESLESDNSRHSELTFVPQLSFVDMVNRENFIFSQPS